MARFVIISGCSSGGKSTLVGELSKRGYQVIEEPGRRIVIQERQRGGTALPWKDLEAFLRKVIDLARDDLAEWASSDGWVFCDRGLLDAAAGLARLTGEPVSSYLGVASAYHGQVFLAPPWPEIYVTDEDRRHPFSEAVQEYERLLEAYPSAGYEVVVLPKTNVGARADFVLRRMQD